MKHTYFYDTLNWIAEGTYYEEDGKPLPLYGEVSIVHTEDEWTLGGFLEVRYAEPIRFTNHYNIHSTKQDTTLLWESFNPALGILKGTFEIIGDCIISHYTSDDGIYSGTETLIYRNCAEYYNAGVSFRYGQKMSSWNAFIKAV